MKSAGADVMKRTPKPNIVAGSMVGNDKNEVYRTAKAWKLSKECNVTMQKE